MKSVLVLALVTSATPALAQSMDHATHNPGVSQPAPTPKPDTSAKTESMPGMDMSPPVSSPDQPQEQQPMGTDQPPGSAEAPPIAHDQPADRYWNAADMAVARDAAMHPPAATYAKLLVDLAEHQFRDGKDGYRWEGEAWFGDLNRFILKSKGEGASAGRVDQAEVQALYSKALDPWWNLQLGARQDLRPRPMRTWATFGIEGRAPYQFDVQVAAFLSGKGQLTGRLEGAYDQRITQRLILQPRVEFDFSAQDVPDQRIGAGLSSAELGLRLRYEIRREFAPYVGLNWTWAAGRTADYSRADGEGSNERSVVAGVRLWL